MTRLLFLFIVSGICACAQFAGLGSTADGATLYFATPLRLRGSGSPFNYKILRLDGQLSEFLSREQGEPVGRTTSNFYDLVSAQSSSDGSFVAVNGTRSCFGGSGCLSVQTAQGTILDRSGKQLFTDYGFVSMSPNGRWALFYARNVFENPLPNAELVDLNSGSVVTTISLPYTFAGRPRRQVANDGTVALIYGSHLYLWRNGGMQPLNGASPLPGTDTNDPQVLISADGGKIVYQTSKGLAIYDQATSTETALATTPSLWASMSDDASVILFVSAADSQVWAASPLHRLTSEADGITEVTTSGNGRVAYAATDGGRVLRIDVATGAVTELIPRSPWITSFSSPVAAGSLYQFTGRNLVEGTDGVRIKIGEVDAPVESVSPAAVWFQVPWEVPVQDAAPVVYSSGTSPLETAPGSLPIQAEAPAFFTSSVSTVLAAHQDFSGLVTNTNPAVPGEVVAMYLNGLGAVAPPVATGAVGPSTPLAAISSPLRCQFFDGTGQPIDGRIYFAGLAPGMVGVYQVSVGVPTGLHSNGVTVSCDFGPGTSSVLGLLPVQP